MKGKSSQKRTKKRNETKEGRKSQSKEKKPYEGKGREVEEAHQNMEEKKE